MGFNVVMNITEGVKREAAKGGFGRDSNDFRILSIFTELICHALPNLDLLRELALTNHAPHAVGYHLSDHLSGVVLYYLSHDLKAHRVPGDYNAL